MTNPPPTPNASKPIWELVIDDMHHRDRTGRERYGTPLQANNGRDALQDAYEECLDMAVYLKQAIVERKRGDAEVERLTAVLHANRCHPDWSYVVAPASGPIDMELAGYEQCHEGVLSVVEKVFHGDQVWRRRRSS